ncbi:MAG: hypothetical protein AAF612_11920 [Planctomycetota bacterium]
MTRAFADRPSIAEANDARRLIDAAAQTPGLVACWTFDEPAGVPRRASAGVGDFALQEIGGAVPRIDDAPVGGHGVRFDVGSHLQIAHGHTGELNIAGPDARVSIFAVVRIDSLDKRGGTIAGMWNEGQGHGDDSGARQYALLLDMPWYGGPKRVTPHVSAEGGATRRADGSMLPWCADYAATPDPYPVGRWCSMGMTYDGLHIHAFLDGQAKPWDLDPIEHRRDDRYFTREAPGGGDRGMNPYHHGRGIFRYDPARHAATKVSGGSPFVVGAREVRGRAGSEPLAGDLAALAVFNTSLTPTEMLALHRAALAPS